MRSSWSMLKLKNGKPSFINREKNLPLFLQLTTDPSGDARCPGVTDYQLTGYTKRRHFSNQPV